MKNNIDDLLREPQPLPDSSPDLRDAVMRAVKASHGGSPASGTPARALSFPWPRLARRLSIIAIATLAALPLIHRMEHRSSVASNAAVPKPDPAIAEQLQAAWSLFGEVTTNAPAVLTRPMRRQFDQLASNICSRTLLASLPVPQER